MGKNITSVFLCLVLCSALALTAFAAEQPLVNDFAGLLDAYEITDLEAMAAEIGEKYQMDAVIVTLDSLNGKTAQAAADDYYDQNGYGEDGVLMLLAMEEREWYITTSGEATFALTDYALYQMEEAFLGDLSNGDYYNAFLSYLWDVDFYINEYLESGAIDGYIPEEDRYYGHTDVVYSEDNIPYGDVAGTVWLISAGIGFVVAGIVILVMRGTMNTTHAQYSAGDYMKPGSYHLTRQQDLFLYSHVTKTRKPEPQSNSRGGGSGVHSSSSGRSHGGRGGRF